MKKRLIVVVGLMLLSAAPLLAADTDEAAVASLSRAQIAAMAAGDQGERDKIWSISADRVVLESDISFRLTEETLYYAANGDKLTRQNFHKGNRVKYFLRSDVVNGVMRHDVFMGVMIKLP